MWKQTPCNKLVIFLSNLLKVKKRQQPDSRGRVQVEAKPSKSNNNHYKSTT